MLGTEKLNPVNGTLIGPCCVTMQEHEELKFKLIDLNLKEQPQNNVNLLSKILESCVSDVWSDEPLVVPYRNGYQWNLMYGAIKPEQRGINRLKDNGVYLLTGGLGGIALSCCEAIAKTVSTPTFILLSRSQMPLEVEWEQILKNPSHPCYEKIMQIRKLKALGATILIYQVDIAQFEPLDNVIRECMTLFGTINGLIHAAGIANAELVQFKSREMAQKVFLPKILGTYNLIKALKGISLDFVVLKSSLAALLGGYRHVDYVGANACLDVFANSDLFSFSSFVVSINWNTWREVGIAAEAARKGEPTFLGKGNDISPHQGQALFLKAVQGNESQVAVSNIDLNGITTKQGLEESTSASPTIKTDRHHLNIVTNYLAPSNEMECTLVHVWEEMLGVEDIGVNDDFFALGGHSLKALNLIERINKLFSCKLPATQIYRSPTIKQLCLTIEQCFVKQQSNIVIPLKMAGEKPPYLFLCHPISGLIYCFNDFSVQSDLPLSIYGLQDPSVDRNRMLYDSLLEMAEDYLSAIKKIQPDGPYFLMGYSFGGNLVYEVAHLLQQEGQKIDLLAMIDSWAINAQEQQNESYFKKQFQTWNQTYLTQIVELAWKREVFLLNHSLSKMNQEMVLFKASHLLDDYKAIEHPTNGWSRYNKGTIICHKIDGTHDTIINANNSVTVIRMNNEIIPE